MDLPIGLDSRIFLLECYLATEADRTRALEERCVNLPRTQVKIFATTCVIQPQRLSRRRSQPSIATMADILDYKER